MSVRRTLTRIVPVCPYGNAEMVCSYRFFKTQRIVKILSRRRFCVLKRPVDFHDKWIDNILFSCYVIVIQRSCKKKRQKSSNLNS